MEYKNTDRQNSYQTQVCIQFPPQAIAFAVIYLASRLEKGLPKNTNWELSVDNFERFHVELPEVESAIFLVLESGVNSSF